MKTVSKDPKWKKNKFSTLYCLFFSTQITGQFFTFLDTHQLSHTTDSNDSEQKNDFC